MRVSANKDQLSGISVRAIAGSYEVILGIDMSEAQAKHLLGFAIQRQELGKSDLHWLRAMRCFADSQRSPRLGDLFSTYEAPIQDFLQCDLTAEPGRRYTYTVRAVLGRPGHLEYGQSASIDIQTESEAPETDGSHAVFFNRGVIGSHAYARSFAAPPSRLEGAERERADRWLSRGLLDAIIAFIGEADGKAYSLRVSAYDLSHPTIVEALQAARLAGSTIAIVYDATVPVDDLGLDIALEARRVATTQAALRNAGLDSAATARASNRPGLVHQSFIVLLENDAPIAVWAGSGDFSELGVLAQVNVGHWVRKPEVARQYLDLWTRLRYGEELAGSCVCDESGANDSETGLGTTVMLCAPSELLPIDRGSEALSREVLSSSFSSTVGLNGLFIDEASIDKAYLRSALVDKWGLSAAKAILVEQALERSRGKSTARAAAGSDILGQLMSDLAYHEDAELKYGHSKFIIIDPLSAEPTVLTAFRDCAASSTVHREMLAIRGDTRIADIYLGEFMRRLEHYRFGSIVMRVDQTTGEKVPNFLEPTSSWTKKLFFDPSHAAFKRRILFA